MNIVLIYRKYHRSIDCKSFNHQSFIRAGFAAQERFNDTGLREEAYKWCQYCIPEEGK